jgi:hypothetical protein
MTRAQLLRASAVALLVVAPRVARAERPVPHLRAVHVDQGPKLDGKLDDPVWQAAPALSAFVQNFPHEGAVPSEPTSVRVVYDSEAVWIGVACTQRTVPIIARLTRRDSPIEADSITIDLDTRRSGTTAFEFSVNAAGVLSDAFRFNDTEWSSDWDENWEARVARTPEGWSAELRIPLRILRYDTALPVQSWGFQARRYISARQETDEAAFIPRTAAGEVSRYGQLDDLRELNAPPPFEFRPFAVGLVRHRDPVPGVLTQGWDWGWSAGLDLKWHLTQSLTLDATFNPDFGQVEADQVILNLTTYEIRFPEKRPFFQEGADVFTTPMTLFYSRRIGLAPPAPALRTGAPFNEQLVDLPSPSTIFGAAKLVGTIGRRLTVGTMTALTASNNVDVQVGAARVSRIAEPWSLFSVLRLRLAAGKNTDVGFMATAANRFEPAVGYPPITDGVPQPLLCPNGTLVGARDRCFNDAYVAGPDVRWRSPSGDYALNAQAIASTLVNGPPRQLPDGNWIKRGNLGWGGTLYLAKQGGKHWLWELQYDVASKQLDYNDLGYMERQNQHLANASLIYRTTERWGKTVETNWRLKYSDRDTLNGLNLARSYALDTDGRFLNFWRWSATVEYRERHFDDREVGDGTTLERERLVSLELELDSDPRRRVYFELFTQAQRIGFTAQHYEADAKLTVRALSQLELELRPLGSYDSGEPRFAEGGERPGELLFGKLTAASVGATLRATYSFTPRLSLQVYTQLFLAYKHYDQLSAFTAAPGQLGPIVRLADLRPSGAVPALNPDIQEGVLNLNAVLRWEYRLGSTLYLVYARSQTPNVMLMSGESSRLDLGAIRRGPAVDVLLLKLTYWWG